MFKLDIIVKTPYQETAKSKQVALVIVHWAFGTMQ